MKIVQVGVYPISADCIRGGVEASVFGLTQELVKQGHDIHVFDVPRMDSKDSIETPIITNGPRISTNTLIVHRYANPGSHNVDQLKCANRMVQDVLAFHPDVVHIHGTGELSANIYTTCQQHGLKLMLTIHGLARIEKKNKLYQAWQNLHTGTDPLCKKRIPALMKALYQFFRQSRVECQLLERADRAIVDTGYLLDALKEYPVKNLPELYVIPQGANEKFYDNSRVICDNSRFKSILCVGAFGVRKSQIELVRAFEKLRERGVEAKLVLCGVVAEQAYFNQLKSVVSASAYKNDIVIKENLPLEQLMQEYRHATIFALHSQEESQGIVFAEAMAMGLPVVSTRVGGIPYVVEQGRTGLLTEYGDIDAAAAAMEMLLKNDTIRTQYAQNAIVAAQSYKWSNIAEEIVKLYQTK